MERLKIEIEIIKTKLLVYMTIAGGSWVYMFKFKNVLLIVILGIIFFISSLVVFYNLYKLGRLGKDKQ